MDLNSDGKNDSKTKKSVKNCVISEKKRSNSVGTINLSHANICKSIGVDCKNSNQTKTNLEDKAMQKKDYKDNQDCLSSVDKNNILTANNSNKESFSMYDTSLSSDLIFKPRNSVSRTPPQLQDKNKNEKFAASDDIPSNETSQKRSRSNSSPTILEGRKKIKKPNFAVALSPNKDLINSCSSNSTENVLNVILDALERVHSDINSFPHNEIKNINSDLFKIHKHVTHLAFKIGQTEKNNIELTNKMNEMCNQTRCSTNSDLYLSQPPLSPLPKKKAYCDAVKYTPASNNPTSSEKISEWKTPPARSSKHETKISLKEGNDSKKLIQEIKENIKIANIDGPLKRIRPLQSGSVIIECQNAAQQEKIKESLERSNKNMEVKDLLSQDPMIMITGIYKGYTPETFIKEFITDNSELMDLFGENVQSQLKYVTRKECKNNAKENWIFQTPPALFKWLIRNNNLVFDLCPAYVQEYTNVLMCYKCCLFGHISKYCKAIDCCHKCGGAHKSTECSVNTFDCPNCKRSNLSERNHSARNLSCPVLLQRRKKLQQQTNYSSVNTFLEKV